MGITTRGGKPWSSFQVGRALSNPAYAGDISHGSIYVADAHPPIIDRATFARAADIAAARSGPHTQRAASPGDYYLTSRITCPHCRCKYVGTAAHGNGGTYRYYTCFTRARYGPKACDALRIPAGETDTAVLHALAAFYAQETELLHGIIARAGAQLDDGCDGRQAQADAISAQIRQASRRHAVPRRVRERHHGRRHRRPAAARPQRKNSSSSRRALGELSDSMHAQPEPPSLVTLGYLRKHLAVLVSDDGEPIERKAAIEALIYEIRITEKGLIPVYQIPAPGTELPGHDPVRAMLDSEPPVGIEPTTCSLRETRPPAPHVLAAPESVPGCTERTSRTR